MTHTHTLMKMRAVPLAARQPRSKKVGEINRVSRLGAVASRLEAVASRWVAIITGPTLVAWWCAQELKTQNCIKRHGWRS